MVAKRIIKHISHISFLLIYSVQKVHKSGLMDRWTGHNIPLPPPFKGGIHSMRYSFILFLYYINVWFQVSSFRLRLNCVKQLPAAQEIPTSAEWQVQGQVQIQGQVQEQSVARLASQWNSYPEYETSYLAPMGVEIFFKLCRSLKKL